MILWFFICIAEALPLKGSCYTWIQKLYFWLLNFQLFCVFALLIWLPKLFWSFNLGSKITLPSFMLFVLILIFLFISWSFHVLDNGFVSTFAALGSNFFLVWVVHIFLCINSCLDAPKYSLLVYWKKMHSLYTLCIIWLNECWFYQICYFENILFRRIFMRSVSFLCAHTACICWYYLNHL